MAESPYRGASRGQQSVANVLGEADGEEIVFKARFRFLLIQTISRMRFEDKIPGEDDEDRYRFIFLLYRIEA